MENQLYLGKYRVITDSTGTSLAGAPPQAGHIFPAAEMETGRLVALEIVPVGSLSAEVREQLAVEAAAAKELNHPNIPALYDFGIEGENLVYVSEPVDGTTLETWVSEQGPMEAGAVLRVALQILSALGAAAYQRILHHAINPKNVLIVPGQSPDGGWPMVKLLHLIGLAPTAGNSLVSGGVPDNSASFASPEQLQTGAVDFRSEIYSLGCTLFYLSTGAVPFQNAGETPDARQAATRRAIDRLSGLPKEARRLLAQMLSSNPDERPLDPLATYGILQQCLSQVERSTARPPTSAIAVAPIPAPAIMAPATRRAFPRKTLAIAASFAALALLAIIAFAAISRKPGVTSAKPSTEEIGVPVGVPERSATPPVAPSSLADQPAAETDASTVAREPAEPSPAEEPPTLKSTAGDESTTARTASAPVETSPSSERPVESNETANPSPPAPAVEAPVEVAATAPTISPVETESPAPAPVVERTDEKRVARASAAESDLPNDKPRETVPKKESARPAVVKKAASDSVPVRRAEPVNDSDLPPVPRRAVRAKFIGTTPDGQWVFGLPSDKQGTVTLPAGETPEKRSRRRVRRAPAEEEPVAEPSPRVLRALPADE